MKELLKGRWKGEYALLITLLALACTVDVC
jgi:hypothetical protein